MGAAALDRDALWAEYQRLASLLRTRITRFERKRYSNLPHAPSKAMNLTRTASRHATWA